MKAPWLCAALVILCPLLVFAQPDDDYELAIPDVTAGAGASFTFEITMDNLDGGDLQGWQIGVCHDNDVLELEEGGVDTSGQDDYGLSWTSYSLSYREDADGEIEGWTAWGLLNVISQVVVEPGVNVFYEPTYRVLDDAEVDSTTSIEWCETLGSPTIAVRLIVDSTEVEPVMVDGEITVTSGVFLRGDVDGDESVDELLDARALLVWGFLDGDPPPCMKAADIDDNGAVEPIEDVMYLVSWAFLDGPEPAVPGTDDCDQDDTVDGLSCSENPECA